MTDSGYASICIPCHANSGYVIICTHVMQWIYQLVHTMLCRVHSLTCSYSFASTPLAAYVFNYNKRGGLLVSLVSEMREELTNLSYQTNIHGEEIERFRDRHARLWHQINVQRGWIARNVKKLTSVESMNKIWTLVILSSAISCTFGLCCTQG